VRIPLTSFLASELRRLRFGVALALVVSILATLPARAAMAAEDPKVIAKVTELNKKALESYESADLDKAKQYLKQALEICETSGLEKHAITARTYIHIGVVLVGGLKQKDLGIKQFRKALEIQPDIQVTRNVATPDVLEAFNEAAAGAGGGDAGGDSGAAGGGDEGDDAKPAGRASAATGLIHTPVTRAKAGAPILIAVKLGANLTAAKKVVLSYRGAGEDDFTAKDMARAAGGRYAGQIPGSVVRGKSVAYFVEAQDDEGTVLGAAGGESKPITVALGGGKKKCPEPAEGEEAAECDEDEGEGGGGGPSLFISLGGGMGVGYATGFSDRTNTLKVTPGFAASSVAQLVPEVGYFVSPDMRLSLQARIQIVAGPNELSVDGKSLAPHKMAVAALARASWFFGTAGGLRPYLSAALGGGQISHVVLFQKAKVCGKDGTTSCIDSVTAGPIFVGGGAGLTYDFTDNVGMLVEVNPLLGFTKFTFHLDFNAGLALRF
jgi:hypothetical protein